MADQNAPPAAPLSALQQWQRVYLELLALGYSTLDALDTIDKTYPGLAMAAKTEHARTSRRGEVRPTPSTHEVRSRK
jgi:hypothetical protein